MPSLRRSAYGRETVSVANHGCLLRKRYQPPAQLWDMYQELRGKVGVTEARRLIEDHMRIRGISYELIAA